MQKEKSRIQQNNNYSKEKVKIFSTRGTFFFIDLELKCSTMVPHLVYGYAMDFKILKLN